MDSLHLSPLKLAALDHEDLQIIAAHTQDAIVPVHAFHFDKERETFSAFCHRFCWEHEGKHHIADQPPLSHRVHSGLSFHHVKAVHYKGFESLGNEHHLNLLTMEAQDSGCIHLIFSGENEIRITAGRIKCYLEDLSHPWPTHLAPVHFL